MNGDSRILMRRREVGRVYPVEPRLVGSRSQGTPQARVIPECIAMSTNIVGNMFCGCAKDCVGQISMYRLEVSLLPPTSWDLKKRWSSVVEHFVPRLQVWILILGRLRGFGTGAGWQRLRANPGPLEQVNDGRTGLEGFQGILPALTKDA